ncbi:MAG: hypothetical protein AB7K86_07345 [Rhodospirillales bacterium]
MAGKGDTGPDKEAGFGGTGSGWLTGGSSEAVVYSGGTMHDAMQQQIAELLAQADLTDEEKQAILIALACPCCGAGGVSLSIKLKDSRE